MTVLNKLPASGQWAIFSRRSFPYSPNTSPEATHLFPATDSISAVSLTAPTRSGQELPLLSFVSQEEGRPQVDNLLREQFSPDGHRLVLSVTVGHGPFARLGLVIVDLVAGTVEALTTEPRYHDSTPAWSPTGDQIAFVRTSVNTGIMGDEGIWVVNADGTNLRWILQPSPTGGRDGFVLHSWNGDGTQIGFRGSNGPALLYRLVAVSNSWLRGLGGKDVGQRPMADWRVGTPAFVGAFSDEPPGTRSYIITGDDQLGTVTRTIVTGAANPNLRFDQARWRPGSNDILYVSELLEGDQTSQKRTYTVYLTDAMGRTPRAIKKVEFQRTFAAWTADGRDVVVLSGLGVGGMLLMIAADGSNERVIQGFGGAPEAQPEWIDLVVLSL